MGRDLITMTKRKVGEAHQEDIEVDKGAVDHPDQLIVAVVTMVELTTVQDHLEEVKVAAWRQDIEVCPTPAPEQKL